MEDKSVAALAEGVKGSETFVCILSEGYFKSEYCNEMRWALDSIGEREADRQHVQKWSMWVPSSTPAAPDDCSRDRIKAIDSIPLHADDAEFFAVRMGKITKRLGKLSVAPAAQAPAQEPHAKENNACCHRRPIECTWPSNAAKPISQCRFCMREFCTGVTSAMREKIREKKV